MPHDVAGEDDAFPFRTAVRAGKEAMSLHGRKFGANLAVKEGRAETHEHTLSQFSSESGGKCPAIAEL
jgi:hypothetical protein